MVYFILQFENIIEAIKSIGFSEYEAKVYISLLKEHPQNGNALSQSSGVPGSKVYEVLRKMQEKGFVFTVTDGDNLKRKRFSPLPYQDLISKTEMEFTQNISLIQESFEMMTKRVISNWTELYNIEGYNTTMELIKEEINNATTEIIMVSWNKEFEILLPSIKEANNRKVNIATITFDEYSEDLSWSHVNHAPIPSALKKHTGELSIVLDNSKAIIFDSATEIPNAVISSYYSMVKAIRNYITHDIYLNRIHSDLNKEFKTLYGDDFKKLYDTTI